MNAFCNAKSGKELRTGNMAEHKAFVIIQAVEYRKSSRRFSCENSVSNRRR
jgi:hypothetical protein